MPGPAMLIGHDGQIILYQTNKLARFQQKIRVRWFTELPVSCSKGLVDQNTFGREIPDQRRKQRAVEIIRRDNASKLAAVEWLGGAILRIRSH